MLENLGRGALAGAVGTIVLDVTTNLDMAVRGRPASAVPAEAARRLAGSVGVHVTAEDGSPASNRLSGAGALLGYATGVGVGALYGVVRARARGVPLPAAGVAVGLAAMAASDTPLVGLGITDPREWGVAGWLADVVPHLAYGFATAAVVDHLARHDRRRSPVDVLLRR